MPRPFVRNYDLLYADKDYGKDIADFAKLTGGELAGKRILEIGAGTGNQTVRLGALARTVVAVETDPDFAECLRAKVEGQGLPNVSIFDTELDRLEGGVFDAAAAFFHVLNYLFPAEMPGFLRAVSSRLVPGGAFVADLWNGEATLRDPPREEDREKRVEGTHVHQHIRPDLSPADRIVRLHYDIAIDRPTGRERFSEDLRLYLWSIEELTTTLNAAGFCDIAVFDYRAFPSPAGPGSFRLWLRARTAGAPESGEK